MKNGFDFTIVFRTISETVFKKYFVQTIFIKSFVFQSQIDTNKNFECLYSKFFCHTSCFSEWGWFYVIINLEVVKKISKLLGCVR